MRIRAFVVVLAVLTCVAGPYAQGPPSAKNVLLNVSVDANDKWVAGLTRENFILNVDGISQQITSFNWGDLPSSIGILVDTSGSMADFKISTATTALSEFITNGNRANEYFVMTFAQSTLPVVDFTSDRAVLAEALKRIAQVKPAKNTAIRDAIDRGLEKLAKGKQPKKVLLVISDGSPDNSSKIDFGALKRIIRESDALIYSITLPDREAPVLQLEGLMFMQDLGGITGGGSFEIYNLKELNAAVVQIWDELKNQYQIGFNAVQGDRQDSKAIWHKVKINVALPESMKRTEKPKIKTRQGIFY